MAPRPLRRRDSVQPSRCRPALLMGVGVGPDARGRDVLSGGHAASAHAETELEGTPAWLGLRGAASRNALTVCAMAGDGCACCAARLPAIASMPRDSMRFPSRVFRLLIQGQTRQQSDLVLIGTGSTGDRRLAADHVLRWLPIANPLSRTAPGEKDMAEAVLWNYREFLVETRA